MIAQVLALSLIGLTSAAPLADRQVPTYPPSTYSRGFTLVVNVTDPAKDLTPSVNDFVISLAHVGAGQNQAIAVQKSAQNSGFVFYQNGTGEEQHSHQTMVITDTSTPLQPTTLFIDPSATNEHVVGVSVSRSTAGIGLSG